MSTAGALWTGEFRAGVETTYATTVTPTRRLYLAPGSGLVPGGSAIRHSVLTGTRAQVVAGRPGASAPGGSFTSMVESGEILELLEMGINGTPVVTTPGGGTTTRLHVYTGPGTPDSGTVQFHDAARPWQMAGVYLNTLRLTGNANAGAELAGDLFGSAITQTALSGSVTSRSPTPYSGWESKLYIDPVSGTDNYGSTLIAAADSIISYDWSLAANNLGRLFTAANTRNMQSAVLGVLEVTGSMVFRAAGARALTEYNNFVAGTLVRLRLRLGDNTVLEGALNSFVDFDISAIWTEFTLLGEEAGVRTYQASFGYVYDATNSLAVRVRAQNARTAAWA
jgi:hypothetical protein